MVIRLSQQYEDVFNLYQVAVYFINSYFTVASKIGVIGKFRYWKDETNIAETWMKSKTFLRSEPQLTDASFKFA